MSYGNEYAQENPFAVDAVRDERAAFIRRTYAHLTGAIFCFAGLLYIFTNTPAIQEPLIRLWGVGNGLLILGLFMVASWVANSWAMNSTSLTKQYMGLMLYTVAEAVIFTPIIWVITVPMGKPEIIVDAALLTFIIFGGLTAFVMITGADFSFLRGFLAVAGFAALGLIIIGAFFGGFQLGTWFSVAMIGLMAGYILYDTSNVMQHYRTDQHVSAALALFASVATMFWYVLRLFMSRD